MCYLSDNALERLKEEYPAGCWVCLDSMDDFQKELKKYGPEDRIVNKKLDAMIACKELVEAFVGEPVNLQQDGRVTIGF